MRLSRQDVRLAIRSFARQPGFTFVAILSLALAIALNTTMYSVLDAMIRPRIDARDPGQLYRVRFWGRPTQPIDAGALNAMLLQSPIVAGGSNEWSNTFETAAVEMGRSFAQVSYAIVGANFFDVLGIAARRGRLFVASDLTSGARPVVISERLAAALSPGAEFPIGASILFDGEHRPVIGIVGGAAALPSERAPEVFDLPTSPGDTATFSFIRLRARVSRLQANQAVAALSQRYAVLAGIPRRDARVEFKPVGESQFSPQRFHYALAAAVIAVLLVGCANLANLQLARGIGRARELALRTALGATRADIVNQLLLESALLAMAGLTAGVVLTYWGVHVMQSRVPPAVADYVIAPQISWRVFAFATLAAAVCVLFIGLVPAIRVSRVDANTLLKAGAGTGANKRNRQHYGIMVALEIALSLALLSGASLVARRAIDIRRINVGYDARPLSTLWMAFARRDTVIGFNTYATGLIARLRGIPDAANAAVSVNRNPVHSTISVDEFGTGPHDVPTLLLHYRVVTPGYFHTLGLPILRGRDFLEGGSATSELIIDEHTARGLFPGGDPIGKQIKLGDFASDAPWLRVVGVVSDIDDLRQLTLYGYDARPSKLGAIYRLAVPSDSIRLTRNGYSVIQALVRAQSEPDRMPVSLRSYLPRDPLVRYSSAESLESALGILRERQRHDFVASVFVTFAVIALGLAALGIYGIVAHSVAERTREIGVRRAVGATSRDILGAVLREGNAMALLGVAVGLYLTKNTAGWLHAFTYDDDQYNAPIFAGAAAILFVVAFLAALIPALRATRIDPVEALRSE